MVVRGKARSTTSPEFMRGVRVDKKKRGVQVFATDQQGGKNRLISKKSQEREAQKGHSGNRKTGTGGKGRQGKLWRRLNEPED